MPIFEVAIACIGFAVVLALAHWAIRWALWRWSTP